MGTPLFMAKELYLVFGFPGKVEKVDSRKGRKRSDGMEDEGKKE